MLNLIALYWKAITLFSYTVGGIMVCYILRNRFKNLEMEDIALFIKEEYQQIEYQQVEKEERVHFLVMTLLVIPMLMFLLRLFFSNLIQYSATVWGYLAMISYLYLVVYHYREKLLVPIFRSKAVSFFVWLGGRLETEIYKEGVGCVLIAALFLTLTILNTINVIPGMLRFSLFLLIGVYLCFRNIALTEASVYIQQVASIRDLRSTIGQLDVDNRYYLPLLPMLLLGGVVAVALVGTCVATPNLQRTNLFVKGCVVLKSVAVKRWDRVKTLITTPWQCQFVM